METTHSLPACGACRAASLLTGLPSKQHQGTVKSREPGQDTPWLGPSLPAPLLRVQPWQALLPLTCAHPTWKLGLE